MLNRTVLLRYKSTLFLLLLALIVLPACLCLGKDVTKNIELTADERAWLDQKHTVRVRVGDWPPFMFTGEKIEGLAIDYLERIFSTHNISYTYVVSDEVPWKQALDYIREHRVVDMVPTAKITPERLKYMAFTTEYLHLPWVIFTRDDSVFVSSIDDLAGRTLCVPEGYVMHSLLESEYPATHLRLVHGVNAVKQCFDMLSSGGVDGFIGNLAVGTYLIQSQGYNNIKVAAPTPFGNHDQAMAVRDDWQELVRIINKTLSSFTPEEHAAIRNRWLSVRYEYGIRPLEIVLWVIGVAAVFSCIVAMILFWTHRLNKEIQMRRKVETRLRESEVKYKSLSDAAFEGIVIVVDQRIVEVNRRMAEMLGYEISELINRPVIEIMTTDEKEKIIARLTTGEEKRVESVIVRKDGTQIPVEIQSKKFSYQGEMGRVSAISDIRQRKKAEEELKTLRGILPLCSFCKKVRYDDGYWEQVDVYLSKHSEVDVSHSLCPECAREHYPMIGSSSS